MLNFDFVPLFRPAVKGCGLFFLLSTSHRVQIRSSDQPNAFVITAAKTAPAPAGDRSADHLAARSPGIAFQPSRSSTTTPTNYA
jgi:hypothetical protein